MGAVKTILLVEDEAILALAESKELERRGYAVLIINRGEDAIRLVRENLAIDLVLMDIDLGHGRMDGTEAARIILENRDIPIVFLSSHTEPDVVEKTEKITSYGYVVKNSGIVVLDASIKMAFRLFDARNRELAKEATLQMSLQTSRDIVQSIPSGLFIYQYSEPDNLVLLDANPAAEAITGRSIAIFRGMEFNDIWPEAESSGIKELFLSPIKTGKTYETEDLFYSDEQLEGAFRVRAFAMPGSRLGVAFENIIERKRAEKELQESEEKFRGLFENINAAAALHEIVFNEEGLPVDFVYLEANSTFEEMTRLKVANIIGKRGREIIPNLEQKWIDIYGNVALTGKSVTVEEHSAYLDRIWEVKAFRPKIGQFAVVFSDITARKRTELELQESEARLRASFTASPGGMAIVNSEGRFISINQAACNLLNYREDELLEISFTEITHHEDIDLSLRRFQEFVNTGVPYTIEKRFLTRSGKTVWGRTTLNPVLNDEGEFLHGVVHLQDITGLKETINNLHENEERYRLLYQSAGIGVGYYSVDGRVIGFNEIALQHMGKTEAEVVGRSFYDLFPEEMAESFMTRLRSAESADTPQEYVDQLLMPGGNLWFLSVYSAVRNSSGKNQGIQIMSVDITKQKSDEERILALLEEKELLMREVHHRVKNNMLTIKELIALQKESTDNNFTREAMEAAENRLTSIMLLYEKLYRNKQITEISAQEYLDPLVDEVVATYAMKAQVRKRIAEWAIPVQVASPLGIILNELISNAMKHAFGAGKKNLLEVSLEKTGRHVTVTVSDNGESPVVEPPGEGFGLNLVRSLAAQIDGEFRIEQDNGARAILKFAVEE